MSNGTLSKNTDRLCALVFSLNFEVFWKPALGTNGRLGCRFGATLRPLRDNVVRLGDKLGIWRLLRSQVGPLAKQTLILPKEFCIG